MQLKPICVVFTGYIENSVHEEAPQLLFVVVEILKKVRFVKNAKSEKIVFTWSSIGGLFPISL